MVNLKLLRKLARSHRWQTKYVASKDLGVPFFDNQLNWSFVQSIFFNWTATYYSLRTDMALGEKFIDEEVYENDDLCDAYLYYRKNKKKLDKKEDTRGSNSQTKGIKINFVPLKKK